MNLDGKRHALIGAMQISADFELERFNFLLTSTDQMSQKCHSGILQPNVLQPAALTVVSASGSI